MIPLNFPRFNLIIRENEGKHEIYDICRKKFVRLTPEEWVRQHFLLYLHYHLGFPLSLIAVEKSFEYNNLTMRFDIVIFERTGKPLMLVECKAPDVEITQEVLNQAGRYNLKLNVPYLIVSNGLKHFCYKIDRAQNRWTHVDRIPTYKELLS